MYWANAQLSSEGMDWMMQKVLLLLLLSSVPLPRDKNNKSALFVIEV